MNVIDNYEFDDMNDEQVYKYLQSMGYQYIRKLDDGEWILIMPLFYTVSVCCGAGKMTPYKYRWCFAERSEAFYFFENCKNYDDIPERRESLKGHRYVDKPRLIEYDELGLPRW